MSFLSSALRSSLSTYRKRKSISIDGSVAGMHPSSPKGHFVTPADGMLGAGCAPGHGSFYDSHAHYRWPARDYEAEPSWFDDAPRATTPPLRLDPVPRPRRPSRVDYLPLTEQMMHDAIQDTVENGSTPGAEALGPAADQEDVLTDDALSPEAGIEPIPLQESETVRRMVGELITGPMEEHPWYGEQEMTEETFLQAMEESTAPNPVDDMIDDPMSEQDDPMAMMYADDGTEAPDGLEAIAQEAMPKPEGMHPEDALPQFHDPAPESGLEAMVQEAMPLPEPEPPPEPEMDPWMMQGGSGPGPFGPGFGPMGPMPGP